MLDSEHNFYRLPVWVKEQLEFPPTDTEKLEVCKGFERDIVELLIAQGIAVFESTSRVKSPLSIQTKISRRLHYYRICPLFDQYGVKVIIPKEGEVYEAGEIIKENYSHYKNLSWPWDPITPPFIKNMTSKRESKYSHPDYRAYQVVVPFGEGPLLYVGEVQLVTEEWEMVNQKTRKYFERQQGRKFWERKFHR